jgi:hypothetical protein
MRSTVEASPLHLTSLAVINGFDVTTGAFVGTIKNVAGKPIKINQLGELNLVADRLPMARQISFSLALFVRSAAVRHHQHPRCRSSLNPLARLLRHRLF